MMRHIKKVLVMAGGTGGHVFPALAVAEAFRERGVEVEWLGTSKGLEAKLVPEHGFKLHFIPIGGLRGKGWREMLSAPWRLLAALKESIKVIRAFDPDVVIGMGGFASGPGGIASFLLRKKLVIHEQNAKAGLTNRYLSKVAIKVLAGFPGAFPAEQHVVVTGNPVRKSVATIVPPENRLMGRAQPRLLILGGSLGAQIFNELAPKALAKLSETERPEVLHQAGIKQFEDTKKRYEDLGVSANVVPFIHAMDKAYEWADVVLCRAGALTIAELCAVGLGAVLVPYPYAVDDHQTANARVMVNQQAAILIQQADLSEEALLKKLRELFSSSEKRIAMAKAAFQLRRVDATEKVLTICEEIFH